LFKSSDANPSGLKSTFFELAMQTIFKLNEDFRFVFKKRVSICLIRALPTFPIPKIKTGIDKLVVID
jgi:hypothetical protein